MNILLNLNQVNQDYIFFGETIKNSIIENGMFTRIIYSDHLMTLNGLYITFCQYNYGDDYLANDNQYNKIIQKGIIETLIELEKLILFKIDINEKNCQYKMKEYFKHLTLKLGDDFKIKNYLLKISGIWQTSNEYGITFKLLEFNDGK